MKTPTAVRLALGFAPSSLSRRRRPMTARLLPILLLLCSNVFMTFACSGAIL